MGAMFGQPVLLFVYFFKKMYDYDDLPKGNNHHYACQGARALVCLRNRHCSSCSFLERKKVILPTLELAATTTTTVAAGALRRCCMLLNVATLAWLHCSLRL